MGERRNRKSFWDTEDESQHMSGMREHNSWAGKDHHSNHGSGRYHDLSDSRTTSTRDSRDHSEWPRWESIEDPIAPMSRVFKNIYERKDISGEKRYQKDISPGFEEMEVHNYNHTHEYDRSHSQRYMRKGRSRSRNRTRTHGRSRSRSLSRGREMERDRGRGWSRSRSRSRSDGYGYANAHRRSRSPIGDYRRPSYGWSDKRSGQEKSSQTCRDFASGRCRKGSQCRFSHPDSISHRDDELVEDDRVESWRGRSDHSQISRHSYTRLGYESRNDMSDRYHGEDEWFLNRGRASIPCRDFKIGNCGWGDACRFSHDTASAEIFGQDTRNTIFDRDYDRHQFKNGKPLCKFFVAGRCTRDNCRFSHDDPNLNDLEGRIDKVTDSKSSHEKSYQRNAPKWDDVTRTSDAPIPTGWGEAIAANTTGAGDVTKRDYSSFSHDDPTHNNLESKLDKITDSKSSHDQSNWLNAPKWDDATRISDAPMPTGWGVAITTNTTSTGDVTNRDYPSFSRDDRNLNSLESGLDRVTDSKSSHDKSYWRNSPKWDDVTRISDAPMPTGWGEATDTNTTSTGDITNGQSDDRWGLKSKKDSKIWGIQDWTSNSVDRGKQPSLLPRENGSYGGEMGATKSFDDDNTPHKQDHLMLNGLQLQNKDGIANLHGLSDLQENQSLNVPSPAHIQQQQCGVTSKAMRSLGSTVPDEIKDSRHTNNSILLFGQSVNQNNTSTFPGYYSVSSESERGQNMLYTNMSNGLATDLNQPETHIHGQNDKNTVQSPGSLEARVPQILINLLTSKHPDQVSNTLVTSAGLHVSPVKVPVSLTQSFVNEHSQSSAALDVSSSRGMFPSLFSVNTSTVQDNVPAVSLDQFNSMGNSRENTEPGNLNLAQATDNQNDHLQLGRSSLLSIVGTGLESSKVKPEFSNQQGEMAANLGVTGDHKATDEESKDMRDNRSSENPEGQAKLEEGFVNKDEKGMRLFKYSLVELIKEILKPIWKEGRMSRDVHKTVVKKVVDKVSSAIQAEHLPKTQDKVDLYLSSSKPKITKLVQAYVDRSRKPDA